MDDFRRQTGVSEENLVEIATLLMRECARVAEESDHHRYHVGSALYCKTASGEETITSNANKIPPFLKDRGFTTHDRIADAHTTLHGEPPILMEAPPSDVMILCCNTPYCANCLKSAIIRGVNALIIDEDAFDQSNPDNTWTQDRIKLWNDLCIPMARAAKMPIYLRSKDGTLTQIVHGVPPAQRPEPSSPARILTEAEVSSLQNNPDLFLSQARGKRCVIAVATDKSTHEKRFIYAEDCAPPGFPAKEAEMRTEQFKDAHYRFPLDPVIHLAMVASKNNLELEDGKILTNFIPSPDRQLDLAYLGFSHMLYTEQHLPATNDAMTAMNLLSQHGIIQYAAVKPEKTIARMIQESFKNLGTQCSLYNGQA